MPESKKKAAKDPFKTRKAKTEATPATDSVAPPEDVAKAIDDFRRCQDQAKHFEGEATVYKDKVSEWAFDHYIGRVRGGQDKSFKVLGDEAMVTYVIMDASAGLTDEDVAEITERFGAEACEALVERDFRTVRFDEKVLAANYEAVVDALSELPDEVLGNLFKPMLMKAKTGAVEKAKSLTKNNDELKALLQALKMKNYIR